MIVSFIIPALNEERHLARCLGSIFALERPAEVTGVEILVVDNQSKDRTSAIALEFGAKVVTVPPGLVSRSRNAGVRASGGRLLAFLDADCEISSDWLTRCAGHVIQPEVLAAGTGMAAPAPTAPWVERCWYTIAYKRPVAESERVDWLMSFNLLVRREAFVQVGGFDESLVTCEDSDFGYKLAARGRLIRDHVARTVHHGESKTLSQFFRREAWRSRGNLPMAFRHGMMARELPSLLGPPAFVVALLAGLILMALAFEWTDLVWTGLSLFVAALLLPATVLLGKGIYPARHGMFFASWVLFSVYLFARFVGMFLPIGRVTDR